ncbi:MAG: hypothetical protein KME18_10510 [Phormidium tanganyikae FI6-MK23]|nr:hypothetical protein [Phormidium tanganyikae FI6-MK23]
MNLDTLSVILKVMGASLVLSIAIKYLAPLAEIEPTTVNVLFAVLSPSLILAIVLLLSSRNSNQNG